MSFIRKLLSLLPNTTITVNGKPYLTRYYPLWKDRTWGNVYIHHFHSSDQGYDLHSHPWRWGLSLILKGGYFEERVRRPVMWDATVGPAVVQKLGNIERREVKAGSLNVIRSSDFHRVDLKDENNGAWSLFVAGRRTRDWGFLNRDTSEFKHFSTNPEAIP